MKFKISLLFASLVGLGCLSQSAFGETSASDSDQARRIKDNPPDHKTDSAEPVAAPQGPALFKLIDTDKDGRISLAEYVAYGKAGKASTGSEKTAAASDVSSKAGDSDQARRTKDSPPYHKAGQADDKPAALPKPDSPGPSMLPSTNTRADRYTAEVFANLDIDHDKFLTQKELDALIGAHQISQP